MSDGLSSLISKTGHIPVLKSSNYTEWLDLVETVLISKGLWGYASGSIARPSEPEKANEFEREDAKASALLKIAAGGEQRAHLIGLRSSQAVLDKLRAVHQVSQQERVQSLLAKFHTFKALDTIELSASRLTQLQLEIAAADSSERPSDSVKKTVFLHSLAEEYQPAIFALKAAGLSTVSFDDIVNRLKEIETTRATTANENLARAAAKTPGQKALEDRPKRKDRRNVECYRCHKKGHFRSECRSEQPAPDTRAAWSVQYQSKFAHQLGYGRPEQQEWILDSGCTTHMTFDRGHFTKYSRDSGTVTIADGKALRVYGKGTIEIPIQGKLTTITGVVYVPDISYNLLSISELTARGMTCQFGKESATLLRNGAILATARKKGMTYVLKAHSDEGALPAARVTESTSVLWHERLGHPGERKLELAKRGCIEGVPQTARHPLACEVCRTTKSTSDRSTSPTKRALEALNRVYVDFWGPYPTPTLGGNRYMLTITDDFSRKSWIYLAKERVEVYLAFRQWQAQSERESGRRLKAIRTDNALEFLKLGKELEKAGVRHELTAGYTPSQNGVAERLNRTVITKARALLAAAQLPAEFWGEAAHTANYLRNLTPLEADETSPEQLWTGNKPKASHLRVFGCVAYTHIPSERREKLEQTAAKGIFVGYAQTARQYRVFNVQDKTVKLYSAITFDETQKGSKLLEGHWDWKGIPAGIARGTPKSGQTEDEDDDILSNIDVHHPEPEHERDEAEEVVEGQLGQDFGNQQLERDEAEEAVEGQLGQDFDDQQPDNARRPVRSKRPPRRYRESSAVALRVDFRPAMEVPTPKTYSEAITGEQARQWKIAINEQLQSLAANHTWDVVDEREATNPIDTKWVFKVKMLPNGQIDKYKARLVARGFTQQYGVDYFETFAPVIRMESLRTLLALAAVRDFEIHQMDVASAYLLGELEEDAYLCPPEGLELSPGKALKLRKGMPGLKQSGRVWNKTVTAFFERMGLRSIPADYCVFVNDEKSLIVALYVDDLVILAASAARIEPLKRALSAEFQMKDLGEANYLLGISIHRNRTQRTLWIDQSHYIKDLLRATEASQSNSVPAAGRANLVRAEPLEALADIGLYQHRIGQLNWLSRATRPDITFATQKLSQHAHKPAQRHQGAVDYLLGYLAMTSSLRIRYSNRAHVSIEGYADADYASDETRRSTMGYVFMFAGGPITWSSRLQRSVSTSTTEAEYYAYAYAGKEAVWLRALLAQLGFEEYLQGPTVIRGDNQGGIALVRNPEFHARTKHIDVSAHYIRELAEDQTIALEYIKTEHMLADILTKLLKKVKHLRNVQQLGLEDWNTS